MKKRALAILILLCMVCSLLPFSAAAASTAALGEHYLSGQAVDNQSANDYSWYSAEIINSYLYEIGNGALMRVQYDGSQVLVENYTSAYKLSGAKRISMELPIFGGFFADSNFYFLVFGQTNYDQNDSQEVLRVVKYDHSWNRITSGSIYGANTYIPFDAGTLRMTEAAGKLYVHTCHEMYDTKGSGVHHQANMTYTFDISSMNTLDSSYAVANIGVGYVSHSFNQFICTDGSSIYRADHGDAYPRSVVLTRCSVYGSLSGVSYRDVFSIIGQTGYNYTGVQVGGMELSANNVLIAGNSVDQSDVANIPNGQQNVFVTVTSKDLGTSTVKWLTSYGADKGVELFPPQLTKISDNQFLLMWEEKSSNLGTCTRMVTLDGDGSTTSPIVTAPVRLSDCKPIALSTGRVAWYVCPNNSTLELCTIDPNRVSELNPKITAAPKAATASEGKTASFTVKASGTGLRYQWQCKVPGGTWKNSTLNTAQEATVKLTAKLSRDGNQYRCKVTDWTGKTVTSKAAKLTVQPLHFTTQPKAKSVNIGEKATFTVKVAGSGLKFQWQYRAPGESWKNSTLSGAKTATLTVKATAGRNGYQYRCKVTDNLGSVINSSAAKLTTQKMKVTTQPKSASANIGETVKFTAKATGQSLQYQWQYKTDAGTWKNTTATGARTATLKVKATTARNGVVYRCKITDSAGNTVNTSSVKLTTQKMKITTQPASKTVSAGTTAKFTVKATGYSLQYQWQYKTDAGTWKNTTVTGAKTATLKVPATTARNGNIYRCIVTDSAGTKVTTKAVKLTVK